MKRTLLAGTFHLLAGAATLVLAAAIFYSCRSGGDPHHEGSSPSHDTPQEETHAETVPQTEPDGGRLTLTETPLPNRREFAPAST